METVTAKAVLFDQRDLRSKRRGAGSADQPRRAGTQDDQVVAASRFRVAPYHRTRVAGEFVSECVGRLSRKHDISPLFEE